MERPKKQVDIVVAYGILHMSMTRIGAAAEVSFVSSALVQRQWYRVEKDLCAHGGETQLPLIMGQLIESALALIASRRTFVYATTLLLLIGDCVVTVHSASKCIVIDE